MCDEIAGRIPMNAGQREILGVVCLRALERGMLEGIGISLTTEEVAQKWGATRWGEAESKSMKEVMRVLAENGLVVAGVGRYWMWEGVAEALGDVFRARGVFDGPGWLSVAKVMGSLERGGERKARLAREKARRAKMEREWEERGLTKRKGRSRTVVLR